MALIGIDLGTTGARSIVYDNSFRVLAQSYREYPLQRRPDGAAEQDANDWWELTVRCVREAVQGAGIPAGEVQGIAVSSQGISVVPTDAAFSPLRPAVSWLDQRGGQELAGLLRTWSAEEIYRITGKRASASYTLPKILWLRGHEPELFQAARWFLLPQDYLLAKLTGIAVTDHTLASGTMLYDLAEAGWHPGLLEYCGLARSRLPEIRWAGEAVGHLTAQAAEMLGLPRQVVVSVGAQDQKCASHAVGLAPGIASCSMGTAAALEVLVGPEHVDGSIPLFNYLSPGERILEGVVGTAGMALRWLRDTLFPQLDYAKLDELAASQAGKCRVLFYPYLSGEGSPGWNNMASARFHGLTLSSAPGDIICGVLEGVALELARNLSAMGEEHSQKLRIFGGGAKSDLWCQIVADCTDRAIQRMDSPEMACLGAALLAGRGCGLRQRQDPTPAALGREFHPLSERREHYREKRLLYRQGYAQDPI